MEQRITDLHQRGEALFSKRITLMSLWQDIADHFYPERADFLNTRTIGDDFAAGLMTSYPVLARRDLGNSFSAMLRPRGKEWFEPTTNHEEKLDRSGREWLQYAGGVQRRTMYDPRALFIRSTKEVDHDFATFGQGVISTQLNGRADGLLYGSWHLRDVAWVENADRIIDEVHCKRHPYARDLLKKFREKCSDEVKRMAEKTPYEEIQCRHVVVPSEFYQDGKKWRQPFVSIYYEVQTGAILEEVGSWTLIYTIPRWQTVSGSQYAYSPATIVALSDARLIQAMTRVLLDAGERATSPPLVAVDDALRSDIANYAGGVTWVDAEYDERLGEVLRPLSIDKSGIPMGLDMQRDIKSMITEAFFLNKLSLPAPQDSHQMTAYESGQRVSEYIRQALPIFEPMEVDYNGAVCQVSFETIFRAGGFGAMNDIPESLRGAEVEFRFKSPLQDAIDSQKGVLLQQSNSLLAQVVQYDASAAYVVDWKTAYIDALNGVGVPAKWQRDPKVIAQMAKAQQEQQDTQQQLAGIQQGADIAKTTGEATQALAPTPSNLTTGGA